MIMALCITICVCFEGGLRTDFGVMSIRCGKAEFATSQPCGEGPSKPMSYDRNTTH